MKKTVLALSLLMSLVACSLIPVSVKELLTHPERYDNHTVTIRGKVVSTTKLPFMKEGMYTINDGTGQITVVTLKSLPPEGKTKTVRGRFSTAFKIMGKSFGFTITEGG